MKTKKTPNKLKQREGSKSIRKEISYSHHEYEPDSGPRKRRETRRTPKKSS
jgi:hypothetical protein